MRRGWIGKEGKVSVKRQCVLAGVSHATFYAQQKLRPAKVDNLRFNRLIDEEYTRHPFYGSRRMVVFLETAGYAVNRKRVQGLMRGMGLAGMAPGPNTSRPCPEHKVYPYLLRGVPVVRPNQVWSTDITYIRLARGFAYLTAVIDWYSRRVLSWRISNSMDAAFCVDCLEDALRSHGKPEIFNTDQGSQFTSAAFIGVLKREDVYLKDYPSMGDLTVGLGIYFTFYNTERPHQALGQKTPDVAYRNAMHGGAVIVDRFPGREKETGLEKDQSGQRRPAENEIKCAA